MNVEFRAEVDATADRLWDILADVKAWPEWQGTSFIEPSLEPLRPGAAFPVELGGLKWTLTVTEADRPRKLVWVGRAMGLKAVHAWEFVEAQGRTTATTRESVSGWTLPLFYPIVRRKLPEADEKWLAALKTRAESTAM